MSVLSKKISCPGRYLTVLSCHSKTSKRRKTNISLEPIGFGKQMFQKKKQYCGYFPTGVLGGNYASPQPKKGNYDIESWAEAVSRCGRNQIKKTLGTIFNSV